MSTSSFFSRSPTSRDTFPLLPQHRASISLADISPRPSISDPREASPSPPPSFYRDKNVAHTESLSPSPSSRAKGKRIQFAEPPPPIATSMVLSPAHENHVHRKAAARSASPRIRQGASASGDPLVGLSRREKAIQGDLQLLLDAQSAGLLQGFGGDDGTSEAGSSTPTRRSGQGRTTGGMVPVRQPKRKTVGLRGARRGLLRCMGELVGVKQEEMSVLLNELEQREQLLVKVERWEKRIESMRSQLNLDSSNGHGRGEESVEIADLQTEERALDSEIRDLEDRLAQMKARKRWLGERITESVNRREAKLSSYRGALRQVESEVKEFLHRPPITVSVLLQHEEGLFALPAGRRTLGMAKEWWNKERSQLQLRQQEAETEKSALEEGAQLWQESILLVMAFEEDLRQHMARPAVPEADMLRAQVGKMSEVIHRLDATCAVAEAKGWNLLICAVGAELEAFREGEGILKAALQAVGGEEGQGGGGDDLLEEDRGVDGGRSGVVREESEDDGPNLAELMVDHGSL